MKNSRIHSWLIVISLVASSTFLSQCQKPGITESPSPGNTSPQARAVTSFVHPGVLNTQLCDRQDCDIIRIR